MRDSIYTIPISEVFEPKCGCPFCSMQKTLESRCIEYILGAAMMEPDVRIETNRLGFCKTHYTIMQGEKNKLALALMIKSHLEEIKQDKPKPAKKKAPLSEPTCFVCKEINGAMQTLMTNTIIRYQNDVEFRKLYCEQEFFCVPHYKMLVEIASTEVHKKLYDSFITDTIMVRDRRFDSVLSNIDEFTQSFDYRNAGKEKTAEVNSAVDSAIKYLCGGSL